ncbi:histidine phosphatase family protein [Pseudarthrobacter oxydans]|uniref:histidine phosphatase family protein n=1 Tax=Pseudarthrobacter oxydans TaxID=1671 RepID=UPI003818BBB1
MKLLLIRHGQTQSNLDRIIDTAVPGASLTELGHAESCALAAGLKTTPIDAIYASTQYRAQQTAAHLAKAAGLPVEVRDGIREVDAGSLDLRSDEVSIQAYKATFMSWANGNLSCCNPGGETGLEAFRRFNEVITEILASGVGTAALVSSGAMLRSWAGYYCQNINAQFVNANSLPNTGVVEVCGNAKQGWVATRWTNGLVSQASAGVGLAESGPAGEAQVSI